MSSKVVLPDPQNAVERYRSGESAKALAESLRISRTTLMRILRELGVRRRGRSAAERAKWRLMDSDARRRQTEAAHKAALGRKVPIKELILRARIREWRRTYLGAYQSELADLLCKQGVPRVRLEAAVERYNVDLLINPPGIAVEIQEGRRTSKMSSLRLHRLEYLLDHGLSLLVIYRRKSEPIALAEVAQNLIAFYHRVSRDPSLIGHYGVIGGDGKPLPALSLNLDHRPRVPGF